MRNALDRSQVYAAQAFRELDAKLNELDDATREEKSDALLTEAIAQGFRDGALAELGETPLISPREIAHRSRR